MTTTKTNISATTTNVPSTITTKTLHLNNNNNNKYNNVNNHHNKLNNQNLCTKTLMTTATSLTASRATQMRLVPVAPCAKARWLPSEDVRRGGCWKPSADTDVCAEVLVVKTRSCSWLAQHSCWEPLLMCFPRSHGSSLAECSAITWSSALAVRIATAHNALKELCDLLGPKTHGCLVIEILEGNEL